MCYEFHERDGTLRDMESGSGNFRNFTINHRSRITVFGFKYVLEPVKWVISEPVTLSDPLSASWICKIRGLCLICQRDCSFGAVLKTLSFTRSSRKSTFDPKRLISMAPRLAFISEARRYIHNPELLMSYLQVMGVLVTRNIGDTT